MDEQPIFTSTTPLIPVTSQAESFLHIVKRWSKFLAIIGFIATAFILISAMFVGNYIAMMNSDSPYSMGSGAAVGFCLIIALVAFIPALYLFKFSTSLEKALVNRSGVFLENAFRHLKSHYQFLAIITILSFLFYIVCLIGFAFISITGPVGS